MLAAALLHKSKKKWNTKQYFEYDLKNIDLKDKDEFLYKKLLLKLYTETLFGFRDGYNKSQETHPFSEEDMIGFNNWCSRNYVYELGYNRWVLNRVYYTTKELLQIWKEQQLKIVYYE